MMRSWKGVSCRESKRQGRVREMEVKGRGLPNSPMALLVFTFLWDLLFSGIPT